MTIDPDELPLSPTGAARRDEIGRLARRAAVGRRRRRRAARAVVAVALLLAAAWPPARRRPSPPGGPPPQAEVAVRSPTPSTPIAPPSPSAVIQFVPTDPTITARLSVRPARPTWVVIDDRQLLDTLAAAGRPAGLVTVDGHTTVWFRARLR